jgi:sugar lactone lactonase YvrE
LSSRFASISVLLLASSLAWPEATPPAQPTLADLALKTREARLAGDNEAWLKHGQATLALAPEHPDLLLSTARAFGASGRADEALNLLEDATRRGARLDVSALPEFKDLEGNARFAAVAAKGRENTVPVSPPEVFLVIEDGNFQPEGITYDADTARLFIGSLHGEIRQVQTNGKPTHFAGEKAGLREVAGLKVDRKRRLLWAATSVFPDFPPTDAPAKPDLGVTGALAFDLDDGRRVRACWLDERPVLHGFNDFALAENGDVYVSDSPASSIYRLPGGECRPEKLIQDPKMSFPNGLALSPDEARLYVAHIEGLSVVDLRSGRRTLLDVPADAAVNSMDGLIRDGADLIGIQPSPNLARVLRIRLSDDGMAIREVVTVSSPPPAGLSQTTGVVVGSNYYSVASTLNPAADAAKPDRGATILRSELRPDR